MEDNTRVDLAENVLSRFTFFTAAIKRSAGVEELNELITRLDSALSQNKITEREYYVLQQSASSHYFSQEYSKIPDSVKFYKV